MKPLTAVRRVARATSAAEVRQTLARALSNTASSKDLVEASIALSAKDPAAALGVARWWRTFLSATGDAGQAYRLKSLGERIRGRWKQAAEASLRAAESSKDARESALLALGAVDAYARAGEAMRAIKLGRRLLARLQKLGETDAAARLRLNLGNALLWQDRYEEAKREYESAIPSLEKQSNLLAAAARLGLSACELYGGDPGKAREQAGLAERAFRDAGAKYYAQLAAVNRWQAEARAGRPDRAWIRLRELLASLESTSDSDAARGEEFLGDMLLHLNLAREATETYESALRRKALRNLPLNRANCYYGLGLASLATGDARAARRWLTKARDLYRKVGNNPWEAAATVALADAAQKSGSAEEAKRLVRAALRLLKRCPSSAFEFQANLLAAELGSKDALDRAKKLARRRVFVHDRWRLEWLSARFAKRPLAYYRRMFDAMLESRAMLSSTVAKAAFLRDKEAALREYLDLLLERGRTQDIQEALRVVRRSRSVALLDEILAGRAKLSASAVARLRELRARLLRQSDFGPGARGVAVAVAPSVSREILALLAEVETGLSEAVTDGADCSILVSGRERCYWIREGQAFSCPMAERELLELLDWLLFDLAQPVVVSSADPRPCLARAADLATAIGWQREWTSVAPTGKFWSVPWTLLSSVCGGEEVVVLPSPAFSALSVLSPLPRKPRVCLWLGRSADLPAAREEVEALLRSIPGAVLCRSRAEAEQVLENGEFDLIHVAGHATSSRENPMFSWVEFDDGIVLAAEIANSGLQVGAAILATCDSGRASLWASDEPDGLTRAFLARGAAWTLSSQWQLDDAAGIAFADALYPRLLAGEPVRQAVSRARDAVRERFGHPYYYAPFYLTGGYQKRFCSTLKKGNQRK
ncbi:MAG: CHAT domain-containing protein [Armatimonadetes bacterium]|nr:MAG: CHAT domain-containing protein [Armatimonadota bacterium]